MSTSIPVEPACSEGRLFIADTWVCGALQERRSFLKVATLAFVAFTARPKPASGRIPNLGG
ncbi:hypothetical protein GPL17_26690 [Bradyrhizobium yuanmingense]|uniref:hypothetical protein n=1 Tax=Bradyrhizobium yuanmingense TaxID=108015 RepID=UPI0012F90214|nr:hypothetical protein [Bradyrhizobium yuanmingense]MVT54065.1 hypothetical protein [Bradyrhizobium yuanmingense]